MLCGMLRNEHDQMAVLVYFARKEDRKVQSSSIVVIRISQFGNCEWQVDGL